MTFEGLISCGHRRSRLSRIENKEGVMRRKTLKNHVWSTMSPVLEPRYGSLAVAAPPGRRYALSHVSEYSISLHSCLIRM